jgi:hypothetical protein
MILLLLRKEMYLPFLLSILLFITIVSSFYNYSALGKESSENDNGGGESEERGNKENSENDNEGGESEERGNKENSENDNEGGESEAEEDFEDMSLNELFDDDSNGDDNTREEKERDKENEEKEHVPFILPFRAVPFP